MPDPTANDEGGWGDLARELGVDAPATPAPQPARFEEEPPPLPQAADVADDEGLTDGLASDEAEGDEPDGEGEEGAEGETGEPGQPGTGRKRRRRRRRRKKGGPEGAEAAAVAATVGEEEAGVVSAVPTESDEQADEEPLGDEAEVEDEDEEPADRPLAVEEDTGSEVLRELIATWNVPAWDDIIGGLYRPDR
ncbi:MAG TPA: hypothetical protein VMZ71_12525 [Gemmataceae bacterium]|nr:hypothetical protein [Gemmataceae bacterium]